MSKSHTTGTVETITAQSDDYWVCVCGNRPEDSGFFMCNDDGRDLSDTPELWAGTLYVCHGCGRLIDIDTVNIATHTVRVVGRVAI